MRLPPQAFPTDVCGTVYARQRGAAWPKPDVVKRKSPPSPATQRSRKWRATRAQLIRRGSRLELSLSSQNKSRTKIPNPQGQGWEKQRKDKSFQYRFSLMVPVEGIEPPLLAEHDFESCASTSSATRARRMIRKRSSRMRPGTGPLFRQRHVPRGTSIYSRAGGVHGRQCTLPGGET